MIINLIHKLIAKSLGKYCCLCDTPIKDTQSYQKKRYKHTKIPRRLCIPCIGSIFIDYKEKIPEATQKELLRIAISAHEDQQRRWAELQKETRQNVEENHNFWEEWNKK